MDQVRADLVSAFRQVCAAPLATAAILASLVLGIGANTAMFSLLNALVMKPLPIQAPDELVTLRTVGRPNADALLSVPEFDALANTGGLPPFAAYSAGQGLDIAPAGQPARWVSGLFVTGDYFNVVGVAPHLGRLLDRNDDDRASPSPVVVLSGSFWRASFGGDPDIVGRTMTIQGLSLTIVGVVDPRFYGLEVGRNFDVALPVSLYGPLFEAPERMLNPRLNWLSVVGRPKSAQPVDELVSTLRAAHGGVLRLAGVPPAVEALRLKDQWDLSPTAASSFGARTSYRQPLLVLFGMVMLLLTIACVNVAHLLHARAGQRQQELAVRLAMGASRRELLRQLAVEALAVAMVGAVGGIGLGFVVGRAVVGLLATSRFPPSLDLSPDWRVLGFTAAVALVTVILASVLPAWRSTRVDPLELLRSQARGAIPGGGRLGTPDFLVGAQIAVALALTVGGVAFTRSFVGLVTLPTGFDGGAVHLVSARFGGTTHDRALPELAEAIRLRLRSVPGVVDAALSWSAPFGVTTFRTFASVDGPPPPELRNLAIQTDQNFVGAEYFGVLGIRLLEGQLFGALQPRPDVIVVSRAFATKFFGGVSPVGRTVWVTPFEHPLEVVGLVDDVKVRSLREAAPPMVYHPWDSRPYGARFIQAVIRSDDRQAPARALSQAVDEIAAGARVDVRSLDAELRDTVVLDRAVATLAAAFATLGLLLSALGVYGVLSQHVTRRTAEMGLRAALGASPAGVTRELFGRTAVVALAGLLGGAGLVWQLSHLVNARLYDVSATDADVVATATLALAAVAAAAALGPALRAARLDPSVALRER